MFHATSATDPAPPDFPGHVPRWGKQLIPVLGAAQVLVLLLPGVVLSTW